MIEEPTFPQIAKRRLLLAMVVAVALALPLVAMQFTDEERWTSADFGFAVFVLDLAAFTFEAAVAGSTAGVSADSLDWP